MGTSGCTPPGTPRNVLRREQAQDLAQQVESIGEYARRGDWDEVIRMASRASDLGAFDGQTRELIRRLAGEKRPGELVEFLRRNGFSDWHEFVDHLKSGLS